MLNVLLEASTRSLAVTAAAFLLSGIFCRNKPAAVRHALWVALLAAMLLMPVLSVVLPAFPLRVLEPAPANTLSSTPFVRISPPLPAAARRIPTAPVSGRFDGQSAAIALYATVTASLIVRLAAGLWNLRRLAGGATPTRIADATVYISPQIAVPVTLGFIRPKILLPPACPEWDERKLRAVLAHEGAHVRRHDWLVSVLARANCALFWFNPIAWWLERRLATLAEDACDDAALAGSADRNHYARVLLEMAQAVYANGGRLRWAATGMAAPTQIARRIELVLDSRRPVTTKLGRTRLAIVLAAAPLISAAAAVQLVPKQQPAIVRDEAAAIQLFTSGFRISADEVAAIERSLEADPDDIAARAKLIGHYHESAQREPWLRHVFWMIQNHPESALFDASRFMMLSRTGTVLNTPADYEQAKALWLEQRRKHPDDELVLAHAASMVENGNGVIGGVPGGVRGGVVGGVTGGLPGGAHEGVVGGVVGGIEGGVAGGVPEGAGLGPATEQIRVAPAVQERKLIRKVQPSYPPLARQARIQGTVRFAVIIGANGRMKNMQLVSGHPLLVPAAQDAVRRYEYGPTLLNGQPAEVITEVRVHFVLDASTPGNGQKESVY